MKPIRNLIKEVVAEYAAHTEDRLTVEGALAGSAIYAAVPGMIDAPVAILKLVDNGHKRVIDNMLLEHHAMLNDEGPLTVAAKQFFKHYDMVQPYGEHVGRSTEHLNVSPRVHYSAGWPSARTLMETHDIRQAFARCDASGPVGEHWSNDLRVLSGILPGYLHAVDEAGIVRRILDIFPINREGFGKLNSAVHTVAVHDNIGQYGGEVSAGMMVSTNSLGYKLEMNLDVCKESPGSGYLTGTRPKNNQWDVRVMFDVTFDFNGFNIGVKNKTWTLTADEQSRISCLFHPYLMNELHGGSKNMIPLPEHYPKNRDLHPNVVAYNSVENAYHLGTASMIPNKEAYEAITRHFKQAGILIEYPELLDEDVLAEHCRHIAGLKEFDEKGIIEFRHLLRQNIDDHRSLTCNVLSVHKEHVFSCPDSEIGAERLKFTFSLLHFSEDEIKPLQTTPRHRPTAVRQAPDLYEFYIWADNQLGDNVLMLSGDHRYTLRSKNTIMLAMLKHIELSKQQKEQDHGQ